MSGTVFRKTHSHNNNIASYANFDCMCKCIEYIYIYITSLHIRKVIMKIEKNICILNFIKINCKKKILCIQENTFKILS